MEVRLAYSALFGVEGEVEVDWFSFPSLFSSGKQTDRIWSSIDILIMATRTTLATRTCRLFR